MLRKIIFKDTKKQTELILPVTPPSFRIETGIRVETINIHGLGDVQFGGFPTLASFAVDCNFPAGDCPFAIGNQQPYRYIDTFQAWMLEKTVLRFVISDTGVNLPVFVESIEYGEQDGTNDVSAVLRLREYRELSAGKVESVSGVSASRSSEEPQKATQSESHTVKKGDTLWAIARKYYGDPNLCWKLATYNGIKNANLIYPGDLVKIPDKGAL